MREVLFRGLRADGKGWVYGDLSKMWNDIPFIMPKCYFATKDLGFNLDDPEEVKKMVNSKELALGGFIEVHPETVGQFVGKFDKNRIEIFLGDLIKHQSSNTIYQVVWSDTRCGFVLFDKDFDMVDIKLSKWGEISEQFEVIGNIHENK